MSAAMEGSMSDQQKTTRSGVKTVELRSVRMAKNLASKKNNPASERAAFAKTLVEESIFRSSALFQHRAKAS